jgi:anti-sigma-K factor RskA
MAGTALTAVATVAIFSAVAVVTALGVHPLVVKLLDYRDQLD